MNFRRKALVVIMFNSKFIKVSFVFSLRNTILISVRRKALVVIGFHFQFVSFHFRSSSDVSKLRSYRVLTPRYLLVEGI